MSCRLFAIVCVAVAWSGVSTPAAEQAVAGTAVYEALQSQERTGVIDVFSLPRSVAPLQFGRLDTPDRQADIWATGQDILAGLAPDERPQQHPHGQQKQQRRDVKLPVVPRDGHQLTPRATSPQRVTRAATYATRDM